MKAKDARKELEGLSGDDLYKKARELYELEVDQLIYIRSRKQKPTASIIEGAVKQVRDWFRKVSVGLAWGNEDTPKNIIEYESAEAYVRNNVVDPKLVRWGIRTRREILKGTPFAVLEAMKDDDLQAAGAMMMAHIRRDFKHYGEVEDKRNAFAEKYGVKRCPYGAEKRHCEHQTTYVMELEEGKLLPASTSDLVFVCKLDKCVEENK